MSKHLKQFHENTPLLGLYVEQMSERTKYGAELLFEKFKNLIIACN